MFHGDFAKLVNVHVVRQVPEFRVAATIRTDALDALYKRLKPKGVTMTCMLSKACGLALAQHPIVNAGCE